MREIRPYGSEGGEAKAFPTPIGHEALLTYALVHKIIFRYSFGII